MFTLPVITTDIWPVSHEQSVELIRNLTKTASEITNLPPQAFSVYVREYPKDAVGAGGTPLSQQFPDAGTPPGQDPSRGHEFLFRAGYFITLRPDSPL